MENQAKVKNKHLILSGVFSAVILAVMFFLWLIINKFTPQEEMHIPKQEKPTYTFPLQTDASASYLYFINCTVEEIKEDTLRYTFGSEEHNYLTFKLMAKCSYNDSSNKTQNVWVPLGSLMEKNNEIYVAYGDLARPEPILPQFATGQRIKELIEEQFKKNNNLETDVSLSVGDKLTLVLAQGENEMAQTNVVEPNGTSDLVYYGSGFTKSLVSEDFVEFVKTGDSMYLPQLSSGEPLIPILRVMFTEDN